MTSSISRGLLRLWLVASVLWAGAIGIITWQMMPPGVSSVAPKVGATDYSQMSDDDLKAAYAATQVAAPDRNPPPAGFVVDKPKTTITFDDLPDAPWVKPTRQSEQIRTAIAVALMPPGFILILGAALVWVIRGFRPMSVTGRN